MKAFKFFAAGEPKGQPRPRAKKASNGWVPVKAIIPEDIA